MPTIWAGSVHLRDKIEQVVEVTGKAGCEEAVVDIEEWLMLATLDILFAAGFGYECNALASAPITGGKAGGGPELSEAYNILFNQGGSTARVLSLLKTIFPLIAHLPLYRNR